NRPAALSQILASVNECTIPTAYRTSATAPRRQRPRALPAAKPCPAGTIECTIHTAYRTSATAAGLPQGPLPPRARLPTPRHTTLCRGIVCGCVCVASLFLVFDRV